MIEELIWLPAWSEDAGRWHEPVSRWEFGFATGVMLAFLFLVAAVANGAAAQSASIYLVCSLALVMIVNLFIPHVGAAITQRRYAPGLGTSVFLVVPSSILLIWNALAGEMISLTWYLLVGVGFLAATAVIWPALFRIGRHLKRE